jgi:hypothetical protein
MGTVPTPGDLYSFRTEPFSEFSPSETGRYAAIKVIGRNEHTIAIAVLDRIWTAAPSLRQTRWASILAERRFAHDGRLAVYGVDTKWWKSADLSDLAFLGRAGLGRRERKLAETILGYGDGAKYSRLSAANYAAEGEWRWVHDRAALTKEAELVGAKFQRELAAQEERYRTRLRMLTWDQLLSETPFERWAPSPPFPPEDFTAEARSVVRHACSALQALGPKPRRADVRAILKRCVDWFNEADERAGGVIETEEREDIFGVLEEMAHVSRQPALVDEMDGWRRW